MLLETRKDGTKFTNRALKESAERLQNLSGQYDDMQKQLVEQVITLPCYCAQRFCPEAWAYFAQHCYCIFVFQQNCHQLSKVLACFASLDPCILSLSYGGALLS